MIPLLFFGQTVTPLVRLIYNHLSYPAHFQVLFNICPAKVRGARRAQLRFRSAPSPLCTFPLGSKIPRQVLRHQSRAFASLLGRRANFDSAALPLHLSRGRSPYGKIETGPGKNVNTLPEPCFYFPARLIAVTKALASLYITDNKFPLILTDPHGCLSL